MTSNKHRFWSNRLIVVLFFALFTGCSYGAECLYFHFISQPLSLCSLSLSLRVCVCVSIYKYNSKEPISSSPKHIQERELEKKETESVKEAMALKKAMVLKLAVVALLLAAVSAKSGVDFYELLSSNNPDAVKLGTYK